MLLPRIIYVTFLACVCCVSPLSASRLNVPRVLLPYNHHTPTNFTLKVSNGGCYQWECSRQEVAVLTGVEEDGCANEVVVSAVSRSPSRQTAIILAHDSGSGDVLRCDVLVDAIHHLEIVTTTRELYEEEAPEAFEVQAYDSQGNQFSTLEGVEMIWELQTLTGHESGGGGVQSVLRFITFDESPYKVPSAIAPLEKAGRQGYMVLIEGRQTGLAKLSVRLSHPAYKHLDTAWVELMVVANLLLDPADSFVLPHTRVHYTVYQLKQGHLAPINLKASRFFLQVSDTSIAELEEDGTTVLAKALGTTQVVLGGSHLVSSQLVRQPAATLHVVEPSHLAISIKPHNSPTLTFGRPYSFLVTVHDAAHNQIFLPDNIVIQTNVPTEYFQTEFATRNGSYIHGTPIATGRTTVTAVLSTVEVGDEVMEISPPLTAAQDIEIFEPVVVVPPLTVLPWDPITRPLYSVNLTAKGGSGSVGWSSSDPEVVMVTQAGVCRTRGLGSATITAAMTSNPHNRDSAQIHIMEAVGLSLLPGEVEVEVEARLPLHVAAHTLYLGAPLPFTACHKLPLSVEPVEPTFSALPDVLLPTIEGSCAVVEVVARTPGFSLVNVTYNSNGNSNIQDKQLKLTASTTVTAYRPLRPLSPSTGETVLALGSSRLVVFEGGPLPWVLKPSSHTTKVSVGERERVEARLVKEGIGQQPGDRHVVEAVCLGLGQTTLTLTVANAPSASLPHPKKVSANVKVICALPDSLSLMAFVRRPTGARSSCPAMAELGRAVAHCHKPLNMEVVVMDTEQRHFDNISSLALEWEVSNVSLAAVPSQQLSTLSQAAIAAGTASAPMRSYQVLNPFGEVGELVVTVHLVGLASGVGAGLDVLPLSASLPLVLVHDAVLDPPAATLYHHTQNKLELSVIGGSGFFELQPPENDIAMVDYHEAKKTVTVSPLGDGELVVALVDVCLEAPRPATSHVRIASVASLDLAVQEVVELGGTLEAEVMALDASGTPLPTHSLMDLQPHPQSTVILARFQGVNDRGNAVYEVRGRHVGDTSLRVSAAAGGGVTDDSGRPRVESPARPIQVFPALTLHPRNITLVVGAVYQFETRGGPYPAPSVEYTITNGTVANTSHAGVVTALALGTTILTARAVSVARQTGKRAIYSQDMVNIHVVPLPKIRIHAPLTCLETGTTMPLLALGLNEHQAPPSYTSATPPLMLEWATSNKQVLSLPGMFRKSGVVENTENQGAARVRAERPGRATVSLKVRVGASASPPYQQTLNNAVLTDKLEIKVFESLKLKYPSDGASQLLMTPHSEARIITNRDGDGQLTYHVVGECSGGGLVVEVGPEGVVTAGEQTGQATVIVTVTESYGVTQSLSVLVEVKKVSYLQAEVGGLVGAVASSPLPWLPVGSSVNLRLTYHDNRGRTFQATNAQPAFRASRFDLVGVSRGANNDSLVVEMVGRGQTVLHLWDHNLPHLHDYLRLGAGPTITPDKAMAAVGVHVCFSSQVAGEAGAAIGNWSIQGDVLTLDNVSGIAVSHYPGRATVLYQASASLTTTTELTVLPLTQITVSSPPHPLTNGKEGARQVAGVELGAEGSTIPPCYPANPPASRPPFSCSVAMFPSLPGIDIGELFSAAPVYVPNQGYGCEVTCLAGPSLGLATLEAALVVEAVAEGDGGLRSGQVQLPFLPAPAPESPTLTLTNQQPSASLLLRGHPDVLAAMTSVDGCVGGVECELGAARGQERTLTVQSKESLWASPLPDAPLEANVTSPLTSSTVQVRIVLESVGDGVCAATPTWDLGLLTLLFSERLLVSLACLSVTAACLFVGYHALLSPGYKQTPHNGVFANSPAPPPAMTAFQPVVSSSPGAGVTSPGGIGRSSPQGYTLWSDTTEPVYGAPPYGRRAYQGSPTYSTTPPRTD